MTTKEKIAIIDLPLIEPKMFYIALGGNDGPNEINPRYLGIYAGWEAKQYVRDQHEKNGTTPETKMEEHERPHAIIMLARVGMIDVQIIDDPAKANEALANLNAKVAATWRENADAKQWRKSSFEKYFFGLRNDKNELQGTSSLLGTIEEVQAMIDKSHADTDDMNRRHKEVSDANGMEYKPWPRAEYFIAVFRVEVDWANMIEVSRASYTVHHKPEDFDWGLGDVYDDNGKLVSGDYTKHFPRNYRYEPADLTAKMMENIRTSRAVAEATSFTYDRLRAEGRLCEDNEEEAVLRDFRERKKRLAKRA